ncbi:hypothetical protein BDQ94DRAFT_134587 [Aspergillus welwitschiae]|uniref:Secreted protein n=1 Tax=Aspergillus welwitschiae TaxID=1341132 RepID=A0A3F3QI61_9EURO|nr:hypothetical protein BDQ94DRAFT_134587 [Aspergillus welwitschiae]RDH38770.1 hypothetical protein BDQ94DRAFT_134587 [Aspergillus welwitschiae]
MMMMMMMMMMVNSLLLKSSLSLLKGALFADLRLNGWLIHRLLPPIITRFVCIARCLERWCAFLEVSFRLLLECYSSNSWLSSLAGV